MDKGFGLRLFQVIEGKGRTRELGQWTSAVTGLRIR